MKLTALALFVVVAPLISGCEKPEAHFRRHHDSESFFRVLNQSIRPGYTIAEVQRLLGPEWTAPTSSDPAAVNNIRLQIAKDGRVKSPDNPDGVQSGDKFLFYSLDDYTRDFNLQFRHGKLINFDPGHYTELKRKAMLKRQEALMATLAEQKGL